MRSPIHLFIFVLIAGLVSDSAYPEEASEERVSFQIRSKLAGPDINEGFVSTIRTFVKEGYKSDTEYGSSEFKLLVIVEDARIYEYSVRLDLVDPNGAALDSTVVLARADRLAHFKLTADGLTSSGTIRVAGESSDEYSENF